MSDIAIRVEGLSKLYQIGAKETYRTLRETLTDTLTAPLRRFRNGAAGDPQADTIWALQDVSFEVKHGEVIGIIGRNGAGKSTLLKILSRITEPTHGRVEIRGRVGSLLEVGTGFHPELSGRENIFLNGAILGMKKAEILRKFDEIVAFAEVEKFIDTPVKHYSSGMYVRLAFAVAAHMETDILIVDEVLSVGDAAFQKKCLNKMSNVAEGGRTILFVSHQLNQIRRLCGTCVWLDQGSIRSIGRTIQTVSEYEAAAAEPTAERVSSGRPQTARFASWHIVGAGSEQVNLLTSSESVTFRFALKLNRPIEYAHQGIALFDAEQRLIWATSASDLSLDAGISYFDYTLPYLPIKPGAYQWQLSIYDENGLLDLWNANPLLLVETKPVTHSNEAWQGILNVPFTLAVQNAMESVEHLDSELRTVQGPA